MTIVIFQVYQFQFNFVSFGFQRNCRQSCRTTGAILSPPAPLTNKDWKEWPTHGLHNRPVYNPSESSSITTDRKERKKYLDVTDDCSNFGVLMHESLHLGLSYVKAVKEYNTIIKNREKTDVEFPKNGIKKTKNGVAENLKQACDVLLDVCRLYCVSNDIGEEFLAKYIDSIRNIDDDK